MRYINKDKILYVETSSSNIIPQSTRGLPVKGKDRYIATIHLIVGYPVEIEFETPEKRDEWVNGLKLTPID